MNKLQLIYRALVVMARDMFIGLILGLASAVLLVKTNSHTYSVVALLVPAGILAGLFKGLAKFIILNISSVLPSKGYRFNYPKYKLLFLWLCLLFGALIYAYGLNPYYWISKPMLLFRDNIILGFARPGIWSAVFAMISILGLWAHFYEPPYNDNEYLPPQEPASNPPEEHPDPPAGE